MLRIHPDMTIWHTITAAIHTTTGRPFALHRATPAAGGSINRTFCLDGTDGSCYFLKLNAAHRHAIFVAEIYGLETIAATATLHVPLPVAHGMTMQQSYLVLEHLEHLELQPRGDAKLLGEQLAALHRCSAPRFGFAHDNFLGTTPQPNGWQDDWMTFWREQRLGHQLRLAAAKGHATELQHLGEQLLDALPALFVGHSPQPSLLHGDLWSGNHAYLADGTPTIFDPSAYYGDRECDIAMTELFGGYPADFYAAYRATWPLDDGYDKRRDLYNLYHILNHANLFGGGYVRQAAEMMRELLRRS